MDNKKTYPHDFKMQLWTDKYRDTIVCTKCWYISYQANDWGTETIDWEWNVVIRTDYRQKNLPESCIC